MSEPPADILRRLKPIPTHTGPPTTTPRDIVGLASDVTPCRIDVVEAAAPALTPLTLGGTAQRRDAWEAAPLQAGLAGAARLVVVTRSPGEESPEAITALAVTPPSSTGSTS